MEVHIACSTEHFVTVYNNCTFQRVSKLSVNSPCRDDADTPIVCRHWLSEHLAILFQCFSTQQYFK